MERRAVLAGVWSSLAATLAGCLGAPSAADCRESLQTDDDDPEERFLEDGEPPESAGAREFLRTVAELTGGRTGFGGRNDTWRVRFSEAGDTWEISYRGTPHAGDDRFRAEIGGLATAFAANRPDGVSLQATSIHECTTGRWHVCAETAAAYERGELGRRRFVDRVHARAEVVNNC